MFKVESLIDNDVLCNVYVGIYNGFTRETITVQVRSISVLVLEVQEGSQRSSFYVSLGPG